MRPEYRNVAGIDVHKRVLVAVVARREAPEEVVAEQRFTTTRAGIQSLAGWLRAQQAEAVVMESTAQYWWPVWIELEPDWPLYLAQARSNAAPHGRKTDRADAARLGETKAVWAVGPRVMRLVWKLLAKGVEYVEQGPRAMNPARLLAKMKRVEREFRIYGFSVAFTALDPESTA